ncbi:14027_t:CDS:2, partial [Funneliformis caledonium]
DNIKFRSLKTIKEYTKASKSLSDFASVKYNARKRSLISKNLLPKLTNNPFFEEETDDIIAINDISCELYFKREDSVNDFFLGKINISQLF